jgi:phosphatidylinositol alpha-1,6-mannosyltransferase
MRVLVLAPPMTPGGIRRYTETLVRALVELMGVESVQVIEIPDDSTSGRLSAGAKWQFALRALREHLRWRSDLIICAHLALAPVGWLLAALNRRPYWVIAYGIEAWRNLPFWKRQALRRADRILAISSFTREHIIRRQQLRSERILNLPCALDDRLLNISPDEEGLTRQLEGRRIVLTVARLAASERYKGHEVVLRALPSVIAQVPDLTYLVVGDGDDRPRLENLTKESGLAEHVLFTGAVTDAQLAAFYRAGHLFVLPASTAVDGPEPKGEGFGIVYLEAMAFGMPVIGPNYGAPAEIIRNGEHGLLVDPTDPADVSKAMLRLLTAPEDARRMGAAAKEWVQREYCYASFRNHLQQIFASSVC